MTYGKFKLDWKNFFLGFGAMAVALILPGISSLFTSFIDMIRSKMPWGDAK